MDSPSDFPSLTFKNGSVLPQILDAYRSSVQTGIQDSWSTLRFTIDWMIKKKVVLPGGQVFSLKKENKNEADKVLDLILTDYVDRICIKVDTILGPALSTGGIIWAGATFIDWERFINEPSLPLLARVLIFGKLSLLSFQGHSVWTEARKRHETLMQTKVSL